MELLVFIFLAGLGISVTSWAIPTKHRQTFIALATFLVFIYLDWVSIVVLAICTLLSYWLTSYGKTNRTKTLLGLFLLLAIFAFVKFNQNFNSDKALFSILGFSFYLFRLIHLAIERYKGNLKDSSLKSWFEYLFFLPIILVGPIERYESFEREVRRRRWDSKLLSAGFEKLLYGWAKIIILGNYVFTTQFDAFFPFFNTHIDWWREYGRCLQYAGNAYFQFAGYSDIAIGLALLMGIRLQENFNFPFLASSVNDFWRRWHISLSEWCRDYIYVPIASKTRMPFWGILASMLILGLWHEFSWRYILWGLMHGVAILIWKLADKKLGKYIPNQTLKTAISTFCTFNFIIISFGLIKDAEIHTTIDVMKTLLFLQ
ncbi:MAG: D-alanyl-lipoteichoic acid acyltransferase DltB (MBOAT superfamily) [Arenicella sp.]